MKIHDLSKRVRLALAVGAAAAALALTSGCSLFTAEPATGPGAGVYAAGVLTATLDKPYAVVSAAAARAGTEIRFIQDNGDSMYDRPEEKRVSIVLTRVTDQQTRVDIRIGSLGDQNMSRMVLDRIKAHL